MGSKSRAAALLVNGEIAAVVTAMRQNVKWSMVPNRYAVSAACDLRLITGTPAAGVTRNAVGNAGGRAGGAHAGGAESAQAQDIHLGR